MKKLIETALPLKEISDSSISEKVRKGHPGNLHLWWNRSPITSSAALAFAALVDDPAEHPDVFATSQEQAEERKRLFDIITALAQGDSRAREDAKAMLGKGKLPTFCDSFSGFGGLTLAVQSLGLSVEASDLNSLAALLTKAAAEVPARFADKHPVNPAPQRIAYQGLQGLQEDVEWYGNWLEARAKEKLEPLYPQVSVSDREYPVYAWIWTRTVRCPNPACACQMPLVSSYNLSRLRGREYWAEPYYVDKDVRFRIHQGICPKEKETNKATGMGARFQCPVCGTITTDAYVKQAGRDKEIRQQLQAVAAVKDDDCRIYLEPDEIQCSATVMKQMVEGPVGALPNNTRWFSTPGFGMTEYADLYLPRQLTMLGTFSELLQEVQNRVSADAAAFGMAEDKRGLADGGEGATAYGQAIVVYLALVIGKMANFHSAVCTWDNRNGNVRAAFTRQAIPMTWTFAECNPFGSATGNYEAMLKNVTDSIVHLPTERTVSVTQRDALTADYPRDMVLFSELPYLDNVGYADLSDYFYIWLRKGLRSVYPELFEKVVTSKEELCSIPEHYDGSAVQAQKVYDQGLEQLFANIERKVSQEYPSMLFYEFSRTDEKALSLPQTVPVSDTPFEILISKLIAAGFRVSAVWPVRTEKANEKYEAVRILLVFRKNIESEGQITRRGFINALKRELPQVLFSRMEEVLNTTDRTIIALGAGLSVYTKYQMIINADGTGMCIRDALQIIYQEAEEYMLQQSAREAVDCADAKED